MGRLIEGDGEASRELIERYRRPLSALLVQSLGSSSEAEDAFQSVWLKVVRSAERYDPLQRFDRWLFAIAWNLVKDEWARRARQAGEAAAAVTTDGVDHRLSAEEQSARRQINERVFAAVESLPDRMAEVILLRYFEDLTEAECAQRLRIPVGTVKSRSHHALRRLRELLEGRDVETAV